MKKITLFFIALLMVSVSISAKETPIAGKWLLTKVETKEKTEEVYSEVEFKSDGYAEWEGSVFGKWEYNKKAKTITIESEMIKEFAAEWEVTKFKNGELVLTKSGSKLSFIKLDKAKIEEDNKNSGLEGSWKITTESGFKILIFELPDLLSIKEDLGGASSSGGGTWIYNSSDKSLLIMANDKDLRGLNKVVKQTDKELDLENKGNAIKVLKLEKSNIAIERLSFSEGDFFNENGDYKYYDEEGKLPWQDYYKILTNMEKVKQLIYNFSTLIDGTETFETKKLTANIVTSADDETMSFDNIFVGFDKESTPDDTEMPISEFSFSNRLFPFESDTYRIVGEEEITTQAGTFNCVVIEAIGDYDENLKIWMIKDKPGILAKVVRDKSGSFGHFIIFSLSEINYQ
ncbi:MAG: hypothetical protein L3J11_00410 [Draconibacterium sp.]|nr:hypothetical protein [Draconibacterium sp.]